MKVTIENNQLVIRLDLAANPQPSSSAKTRVVATTGGFSRTDVEYKGGTISIGVNATIPNK